MEAVGTTFDSGLLSSERIEERCEVFIRVSEAQPDIRTKSGSGSYSLNQNSDWTLEQDSFAKRIFDELVCVHESTHLMLRGHIHSTEQVLLIKCFLQCRN